MNEELKPCPFCKGKADIVICDDEGNIRGVNYELNPWSGLWYKIRHCQEVEDCPATTDEKGGLWMYETREKAIKSWNNRYNECDRNALLDLADDIENSIKDFGTEGAIAWVMTDIVNEIRKACGVVNETNN